MGSTSAEAVTFKIIDNSTKPKTLQAVLRQWVENSRTLDVATGYFEVGALLALEEGWQNLDNLRILMGDEVSKRTRDALIEGTAAAQRVLDDSLEREKEKNDFLSGVPAIIDALKREQIEARVYTKGKFHAKTYIARDREGLFSTSALVGSSNFTPPGLTQNVELNVQLRNDDHVKHDVAALQGWFDEHWEKAEQINPELLKVFDRHTRAYSPFEVYAKALHEFFKGHEMTLSEWEREESRIFPLLAHYQREGYQGVMQIAKRYNGAFLCDGVGLGKTFIGLMIIERLIAYERKRVVLFVPKATRDVVWEPVVRKYLPHIGSQDFSNLVIINHTDLSSSGWEQRLENIKEMADAIIIDEAHHFRNPGKQDSRYRKMYDLAENKQLFLLTATPINNSLLDFEHMVELFSRDDTAYFSRPPLGIHSLRGHIRRLERIIEEHLQTNDEASVIEINQSEAEDVLVSDKLFRELVVQRSRSYVKASQKQLEEDQVLFPEREVPQVVDYSLAKTYGSLLNKLEKAFRKEKPLFTLAMYYPLAYYTGTEKIDEFDAGRQKQVVGLIRTQFLKRFESSVEAFAMSCESLLLKLRTFATKHCVSPQDIARLERWETRHQDLIDYLSINHQQDETEAEEDIISDEMMEAFDDLDPNEYDIGGMLFDTFMDMDQLAEFIDELRGCDPSHDDKLQALKHLLEDNRLLNQHKVIIFTEYMATARYLRAQLEASGITDIDEVDSGVKGNRTDIITQFAPYYNESSSSELAQRGLSETRVLIATDVLAEGLNLQDATFLVNYDIHWNPVRLMQRIGRVDRRLNPDIEAAILEDHPEQQETRGKVAYWNFLPPDELEKLLRLYKRVTSKTLRISRTLGIEGGQLLTSEDSYEALKNFNHAYEGSQTSLEKMRLKYTQMLKDNPVLEHQLDSFPKKVFSGKESLPSKAQAVFFCYALPGKSGEGDEAIWTEDSGFTKWYLYNLQTEQITDEPPPIDAWIDSTPETPRHCTLPQETLIEIRKKLDRHVKNTYLKKVQAPITVKPTLKAWLELS